MKSYKIIGLSIIVLLILSGCDIGSGSQLTMKDLRTGTDAIVMKFVPGNYDLEVLQGDEFVINLEILNKGATDVKEFYFMLGVEEDYMQKSKEEFDGVPVGEKILVNSGVIKGKSPEMPGGDIRFYEAVLKAKPITLSKLQETFVTGIACYDYRTIAEASVCLSPQTLSLDIEPSCKPEDISLSSQGAPLVVSQIEVNSRSMSDGKVRNIFKITVENHGTGTILKPAIANAFCSSEAVGDPTAWNHFAPYVFLGNQQISCRSLKEDYLIRLINNKAELICELITDASAAYTTPLNIQLDYGYTETVTKKVIIEKI